MSETYRPHTNAQRSAAIDAVAAYLLLTTANSTILTLIKSQFEAERDAYQAALDAYAPLLSAAKAASKAADDKDKDFDYAFRGLATSFKTEAGLPAPRTVKDLLAGVLPSKLVDMPYRDEVDHANTLIARLPGRTELRYDSTALAAFETATAALETATVADEAATRARLSAGADLSAARDAFDVAYMKLIHAAKNILSDAEMRAAFPRFLRSSGSKSESSAAEAPSTAGGSTTTSS